MVTMCERDEPEWGPGDHEAVAVAQRQAWAQTTPGERLAWLEESLEFALASGALARDRARRAEAARRWGAS